MEASQAGTIFDSMASGSARPMGRKMAGPMETAMATQSRIIGGAKTVLKVSCWLGASPRIFLLS